MTCDHCGNDTTDILTCEECGDQVCGDCHDGAICRGCESEREDEAEDAREAAAEDAHEARREAWRET